MFALFDKLCLLSDGHVVYYGAANRAIDFFAEAGLGVPANRNPAGEALLWLGLLLLGLGAGGQHSSCA